jgi:2-polyprenyl-3-methyl-5-hydroxy-6-metoxy-1,4-benzoquinol methylase
MLRRPHKSDHFDSIAPEYEGLIPPHVRERLLLRKIDIMTDCLQEHGIGPGARGLDVGCGQGSYASELAARGFKMSGIEQSDGQLQKAQRYVAKEGVEVDLRLGSALSLPYAHETFDFVYLINVIHHVPGREARDQALREVLRVLREGGILFLHEINTENPLFRFYMGYVFPFIRRIDDGTEEWTLPSCLPDVAAQQWRDRIVFFTFLPEFVPRWLFKLFAGLELALERSRFRHYSAHFMASLVKAPVPRSMVQVYDEPPQLSRQRQAPRLGP